MNTVLLRDAEVDGRLVDVKISGGRIVGIGTQTPSAGGSSIDCCGGALLPGLHDHHIHLASLAADMESVKVGPPAVNDRGEMLLALRAAASRLGTGQWVRANGYHEKVAGKLDREVLDSMIGDRPLRVQHRSGAMWVLNSVAIETCRLDGERHPGVERDGMERVTGRIFGADSWLRKRMPSGPVPNIAAVGARLASYGVTGVTDATPSDQLDDLRLLAEAVKSGDIRQRVVAMGGVELAESDFPEQLEKGPVKLVVADHCLPELDALAAAISRAHEAGRHVAIHCVTNEAIILALAAWNTAGSLPGDRIEHGSIINTDTQSMIAKAGLTVVTQPSFIYERGDDYMLDVEQDDQPFLYRCASLQDSGIGVAGSTDSPFGDPDPWLAIRTAVDRRTRSGEILGSDEKLTPAQAIDLFLGPLDDPVGPPRRVEVAMAADLCLMSLPMAQVIESIDSSNVSMTLRNGMVIFER